MPAKKRLKVAKEVIDAAASDTLHAVRDFLGQIAINQTFWFRVLCGLHAGQQWRSLVQELQDWKGLSPDAWPKGVGYSFCVCLKLTLTGSSQREMLLAKYSDKVKDLYNHQVHVHMQLCSWFNLSVCTHEQA